MQARQLEQLLMNLYEKTLLSPAAHAIKGRTSFRLPFLLKRELWMVTWIGPGNARFLKKTRNLGLDEIKSPKTRCQPVYICIISIKTTCYEQLSA